MKKTIIYLLITFFFTSAIKADKALNINKLETDKLISQCESAQWNKDNLLKLKNTHFEIKEDQTRANLALQLLNCLATPDPELRDGIGFEALSTWMRNEKLDHSTILQIFDVLNIALTNGKNDEQGIYLPFVTLVLAEVARVDRLTSILSAQQRDLLINSIATYLEQQRDYRGFDDTIGWRHGIAHSADLMLQLSLNANITKPQLNILLNALASQISAQDEHFYIYGEPKRLAMPVIYIFLRDELSVEEWTKWLESVVSPAPLEKWSEAYKSQFGLAKLHNTQSFLLNVYAMIKNSKNPKLINMISSLEKALAVTN